MSQSAYADVIRDGLFDPSPRESVARVKSAVARQLGDLDESAAIHSTEYFNHTYVPDFVLSWPDHSKRRVFLRMSYDLDALAEDVALVESDDGALINGLTPGEQQIPERLLPVLNSTNVMFAEPDAIERLVDRKHDDAAAGLLSNALAQGGRGLFVGDEAARFAQVVSEGLDAASSLVTESTALALAEIQAHLQQPQAWRMSRVLQAVWEGSEGALTTFPGEPDLSGRLNVDSLRYLVTYMRTRDLEFWRRVGRTVTLKDLEMLDLPFDGPNVQSLIRANLDVIQARASVVVDDPLGLEWFDRSAPFAWNKRGPRVTLEGPDFFAFLGESKSDLEALMKPRANALSISRFIERARASVLAEVTLHLGREITILKSEDSLIDRERLRRQSDTNTEVTNAISQSPSGRVTVDLAAQTGTGRTRSRVRMADLLAACLPLLRDLNDDQRSDLRDFLGYDVREDSTLMSLFDELDDETES